MITAICSLLMGLVFMALSIAILFVCMDTDEFKLILLPMLLAVVGVWFLLYGANEINKVNYPTGKQFKKTIVYRITGDKLTRVDTILTEIKTN